MPAGKKAIRLRLDRRFINGLLLSHEAKRLAVESALGEPLPTLSRFITGGTGKTEAAITYGSSVLDPRSEKRKEVLLARRQKG
jgi:hypothetical protein